MREHPQTLPSVSSWVHGSVSVCEPLKGGGYSRSTTTQNNTKQYNTKQYNTIQNNTIQKTKTKNNTIQNKTIQNNTIQNNAIQNNTHTKKTIQNNTNQYKTIQTYTKQYIQYKTIQYKQKNTQYNHTLCPSLYIFRAKYCTHYCELAVSWWVDGSVRACVCVYIVIAKYFPCI